MLDPLLRQPLAQRVATLLAAAIARGEWVDFLPGERVLCQRLEVSRPVLREALRHLELAGSISSEPNRVRRILSSPGKSRRAKIKVIFVLGGDHNLEKNADDPLVVAARESLAKHGIEAELRSDTAARAALDKIPRPPDTVWVLIAVSESAQRWFYERKIPAIVAGSTYRGVEFPSVDMDHRAVGRHAVGQFLRNGHRRIGLVVTDRPRAGDIETEEGFMEGIRLATYEGISSTIIRTRAETGELSNKLSRVLRTGKAPTAMLVCHAHLALTVLTFSQSIGLKVPEQLSLISRDSAFFLSYTHPVIARYELCHATCARLLTRLILKMPRHRTERRLFPKFITGQSVTTR